ncbi:MAG TPA: hypothetical protein VGT78_13005 [Rhizomicrobium sp.]|nr:hypothetical protein [Rhizomicrobium sp.]
MKIKAFIFALVLLPAYSYAAETQFSDGQTVTVQPDKAYILVRTVHVQGPALSGTLDPAPILVRVHGDDNVKQSETIAEQYLDQQRDEVRYNVVEPLADHPYVDKDGEELLIEIVEPGQYVLGGMSATNWAMKSRGVMIASLCMGTLKFDAKPGVLTDLGTIFVVHDDQPTTIPELSKVVSGRPRGFGSVPYDVAVRPASVSTNIPDALKNLPIIAANYYAVGAFPNYLGAMLTRLAPVPGVLDYDKDGNVVDLKAVATTINPPQIAPPAQSTQHQ